MTKPKSKKGWLLVPKEFSDVIEDFVEHKGAKLGFTTKIELFKADV